MKALKYAGRFLMRSKSYTIINIAGLALSLACSIILIRYIHQELQVNTHCTDNNQIYIPLRDIDGNIYAGNIYSGADTAYYPPEAIQEKSRLITLNNDHVIIDEKPYTAQILVADTAFFHFFTYPLLQGKLLQSPNEVLVTRQFANRVFGDKNPIGKTLIYSGKHLLTVCGIIDKPICKSSLAFDIVLNFELKNSEVSWGKMYIELLRFIPGIDVNKINIASNIYRQVNDYRIRYNFIPVSELYWNKELAAKGEDSEMWHYNSYSHIIILSGVCLLLLLSGILNFINIYLVFMLKRSKEYGIKKVFGMQGHSLFLQLWVENTILIFSALFLAWFFIEILSGYANRLLESDISYTSFDWKLSLTILILLPLFTIAYPYIKYNRLPPIVSIRAIGTSRPSVTIRSVFLFIQYCATLLLVILSLYFGKHLYFLQNTPPGYRTQSILYVDLMPAPSSWWESSREENEKRWQNIEAMRQKLDECPYIEQWFCGNIERCGILSAGSISTLVNDKGDKLKLKILLVPLEFFKLYNLHLTDGALPYKTNDYENFLIAMNESALKAFGYTRREDAFVKGESALWVSPRSTKDGTSLMPVEAVIKDYYAGHLTAGKQPIVYMVSLNDEITSQYQIACKIGKEHQLIEYIKKHKQEIYHTDELNYHWLEDDVKSLYQNDRRVTVVFTLFASISIFVSVLGLFGLSLFDIRQRYREIAIRKVNGAQLKDLYLILFRKYIRIIASAVLVTIPISYYLIYIYTDDFIIKAPVSLSIFIIAISMVAIISFATLLWQIHKAANINSSLILKGE